MHDEGFSREVEVRDAFACPAMVCFGLSRSSRVTHVWALKILKDEDMFKRVREVVSRHFITITFSEEHLNQIPGLSMAPISCRHEGFNKTTNVRKKPKNLANPAILSDDDSISLATLSNGFGQTKIFGPPGPMGRLARTLHSEIERRSIGTPHVWVFLRDEAFSNEVPNHTNLLRWHQGFCLIPSRSLFTSKVQQQPGQRHDVDSAFSRTSFASDSSCGWWWSLAWTFASNGCEETSCTPTQEDVCGSRLWRSATHLLFG